MMGKIRQEENAAKGRRERKTPNERMERREREGRATAGREGYEGKDMQERGGGESRN